MRQLTADTLLTLNARMDKYRALSMDPNSTRLGSSMYELLSTGYKLLLQAAETKNRDLYYEVALMKELQYLHTQAQQLKGMSRAERERCEANYEYGASHKLQLVG